MQRNRDNGCGWRTAWFGNVMKNGGEAARDTLLVKLGAE